MSYTGRFEHDVFISYAHFDDESLVEGERGWVSNLHYALDVRLRQILGSECQIWRDARLRGNDEFAEVLTDRFQDVAVLLPVLSPRYVRSEWCQREVDGFSTAASRNLGIDIQGRSRIFKVVKTEIEFEEQPEVLQGLLGYEFYGKEPMTGRPREFSQEAGPQKDARYWEKLEDLAFELSLVLKELAGAKGGPATSADTVYLSPATTDLTAEYDLIKRELQHSGHLVLPNRPLPGNFAEIEKAVREDLEKSRLSIHLVGANYASIPEGASRSLTEIQNDLAVEFCSKTEFARVIWMPERLRTDDERQQKLVEKLQTDSAALACAELLETDLVELKSCVKDLLEARQEVKRPASDGEPLYVYVIYSEADFDQAAELEDALFEMGFEVISPLLEADEKEALEDHQESLRRCDAAILYHGESAESWFRKRLRELEDTTRKEGRQVPKAVCLGPPETPAKKRYRTRNATVIKGFSAFDSSLLTDFLSTCGKEEGGES